MTWRGGALELMLHASDTHNVTDSSAVTQGIALLIALHCIALHYSLHPHATVWHDLCVPQCRAEFIGGLPDPVAWRSRMRMGGQLQSHDREPDVASAQAPASWTLSNA